jgi:hypothetical protein
MPFTLADVVPWGRSFDEYVAMFALVQRDFEDAILGCGDGPAAVAREVRIFPLCELGFHTERVRVDYEFQHGANEMLTVKRSPSSGNGNKS